MENAKKQPNFGIIFGKQYNLSLDGAKFITQTNLTGSLINYKMILDYNLSFSDLFFEEDTLFLEKYNIIVERLGKENKNLYTDIYENEQLGLEQDKGKERRQRIYRRLFTENVVYKEDSEDQDYNYIRNYRGIINQDVDKMLESTLEVHKNGAYILLIPLSLSALSIANESL